ncbi:hypothetical protein WT14_22155 [Burkholderia stagnalis]|nr:hypothetical protein WT14_22155 [Burkholderia stagnalis]
MLIMFDSTKFVDAAHTSIEILAIGVCLSIALLGRECFDILDGCSNSSYFVRGQSWLLKRHS